MDYEITLPGGDKLIGMEPVVVVGPNGSGKSKYAREISANTYIEFVNALRNTRVSQSVPAMSFTDAQSNFAIQRNQARSNYWDQTQDFDVMLSQLLARDAMSDKKFVRSHRDDPSFAGKPESTPLSRVEDLWKDIFPGRKLEWAEWKPKITSEIDPANVVEYSGNQMSDGEKAALYLAGRVLSADPGVLIVDEPETHLHTLLAIQLWDVLERERRDIRFVYITHDLSFALSRANARYVLANPIGGLKALDLKADLPSDVAEILLGSASLSFYASRVVFTEGTPGSLDDSFYRAWFKGRDTVVRGVGSCNMVIRCTDALPQSGIAQSLASQGIIDGDFHSEEFRNSRSESLHVLPHHEVESLLCLPEVVSAVAKHLGQNLDEVAYAKKLFATVNDNERIRIIVERWKRRIEPEVTNLSRQISNRPRVIDELLVAVKDIFEQSNWKFSPVEILKEEKLRVESVSKVEDLLVIFPGKVMVATAASEVGLKPLKYPELIVEALVSTNPILLNLGRELEFVLKKYLPPRFI